MKIKKCSLDDILDLQKIYRQTFFETFSEQNSEENIRIFLDKAYSEEKLKSEIENKESETFLAVGPFNSRQETVNVMKYFTTKFFRFLVGVRKLKNMTQDTYSFVPIQNFCADSDIDWTKSIAEIDKQLYIKYGLSPEEIRFIETMIAPM